MLTLLLCSWRWFSNQWLCWQEMRKPLFIKHWCTCGCRPNDLCWASCVLATCEGLIRTVQMTTESLFLRKRCTCHLITWALHVSQHATSEVISKFYENHMLKWENHNYIVCVLNNWFDRRTKEVFLKDSYYAHVAADSMEKYWAKIAPSHKNSPVKCALL